MQKSFWRWSGILPWVALMSLFAGIGMAWGQSAGIIEAEFVFREAPFRQCHASTIAETSHGLVAAWFAGTHEKHPDVGIWVSRRSRSGWTAPVEVVNGVQNNHTRYPCWNPVLYQAAGGPLLLFYKVGPSPSRWWAMLTKSPDGGTSWTEPVRLPRGILGPIKNKPIQLADGRLLCGSSTEDQGWRVHLEWTFDLGKTWSRTDALNDGSAVGAIQPTILNHGRGRLQILCRTRRLGQIVQAWSDDHGTTWTKLEPIGLPNPNSGIDAVTLQDGRHLLVYNHTRRGRTPLNVALSEDGKKWLGAIVLEDQPGEFSYPAVIQTSDQLVHVTYTWKRQRIKHIVLTRPCGRTNVGRSATPSYKRASTARASYRGRH